ncbi:MAG TPA: TDP-N-acetylfucosamine:lipid II N-acetylfucosaminyltransferase [Accumulibacter sp.]|uniref:TDP-N-acetylfucosamine:lipid II N-acetylfucosaminyltransferase n=1 Tax=Accumulibacter sp. TaxID=2053492 RepID=UPI002B951A5D|nr:TDP-N-acetylfucosamine:lipid II N-acetylfucosaminyltransferase [Accumulibacter sp.]HMW54780.1 TDP-N-acetylfucosamine:lipid II N-acetylfucosaminyltransferase [Accumulibacter sp.]HNG77946.1 TDP-N-acetylfucosamine:lipid II N-acetylfucosaminyltransferase [Burkholderiaceae bacterium]
MHIVHLVSDEKFISFISEIFASIPGITNSYLIAVPDVKQPLKYLKKLESKVVVDKHTITQIPAVYHTHDAIIIHYLDILKIKIINHLTTSAPIVWSGWGADYYETFTPLKMDILGPETQALDASIKAKRSLLAKVRDQLRALKIQFIDEPALIKFSKKIKYFSAPIPNDIDIIKNILPLRTEYLQINYGSVEKTFNIGPTITSGSDILVGNSASASNNHLEIFKALSHLDLGSRRTIVPLSYGDQIYRDYVIEAGKKILGRRFVPLVDFMPLEAYNTLISNCSLVVMGHRRQQAVGNIATMLYKGARVFLDQSTTTYNFLKSRGAIIYRLEDMDEARTNAALLQPLTQDAQLTNIRIITELWSQQRVNENVRQLVARLQTQDLVKPDVHGE